MIAGYDEAEWARRLHYATRPIGPSLDALAASRATTGDVLDRLTRCRVERRRARHSESGGYGVDGGSRSTPAHAHDHADQIRRARVEAAAGPTAGGRG